MEQFKFRAYHKIQKRMFPVYCLGTSWLTEDTLYGVDPGQNCFDEEQMKDIIIMQSTGVKDWFGKPIFSGDILYDGTFRFVVGYDKEAARFTLDMYDYSHGHKRNPSEYKICVETMGFDEFDPLEVSSIIEGNIHEHPEILQL